MPGQPFPGSKRNIEGRLQESAFEFIRHDIVEGILREVDQIYHLACPASPVHYQHNPVKTVTANVMGTLNCLGNRQNRVDIRITRIFNTYGAPHVFRRWAGGEQLRRAGAA